MVPGLPEAQQVDPKAKGLKYPPRQEITLRGKRVTVWVHPPEKGAFARLTEGSKERT